MKDNRFFFIFKLTFYQFLALALVRTNVDKWYLVCVFFMRTYVMSPLSHLNILHHFYRVEHVLSVSHCSQLLIFI